MQRAILTIVCLLALGAPAAHAQGACISKEQIIGYFEGALPGVRYAVYTGLDSEAIKAGLSRNGKSLVGERIFVVFSHPDKGNVLVVGFADGCREAQAEISPETLDLWLAGQEAVQ